MLHTTVNYNDLKIALNGMPLPMAPTMANDLPAVQHATRFKTKALIVMDRGEERRSEVIHYADPAFFDVFTFPLRRVAARAGVASLQ